MSGGKTLASEMVASVTSDPLRRADTMGENILDLPLSRIARS